jgi:formylglycine-generating enzyme required for sulfatase activity
VAGASIGCLCCLFAAACSDNGGISTTQDADSDDAATDSGPTDAADLDEDGDGYPASQDCDDDDYAVYPGVARDCQSECDNGTETCLDTGEWSQCTAIADCDCDNPGESRVVDCGNCGQASQECGSDLKWSFPGECLNEGECAPGELDIAPCEFLGEKQRLCTQQCEWGEWDESDCSECDPGTTDATSVGCTELWEVRQLECDAEGNWVVITPCTADCILPARTNTPDYKDEICIPGGPFIMGSDPGEGNANERPEHEVILTPYYIDKFEVTVGRYQECVTDGVCVELYAPEDSDYPAYNVTYDEAATFCQWDGGRVLPTEAQWEKAARGPSPREVPYPWGDDLPTCELVVASGCGAGHVKPVDVRPDGVSYYGVFQMAGNVSERCADYYDPDYYASSPIVDPIGPMTGTDRAMRGRDAYQPTEAFDNGPVVTFRHTDGLADGFRCARRGY